MVSFTYSVVIALLALVSSSAFAAQARFVIDDDEYLDRITNSCAKLLQKGKLKPLSALRSQVRTKSCALKLIPPSHEKSDPPEIYDRLRESTLAVGSYYLCPDCGEFHFNSSTGFVVAEDGVVSTCCHVIMAQDEGVSVAYLAAADASGRVYPVQSVMAADTEADTCLLKIDARGLKPLAFRPDVRPGTRVYCLSHPGGNHFMLSEGLVARLNRRRDEVPDDHGKPDYVQTRPILYLNVTAEFAPGSSGAPVVDEFGNVVGQVSSIAEAGEPSTGDENNAPAPSVAIRFCLASEEIVRLTNPHLKIEPLVFAPKPVPRHPSHSSTNQAAKVPSSK